MSDTFGWLTVLGAIPLVGSVVVAALPRGRDLLAKQVALAVSLVTLGVAVAVASLFQVGGPRYQLTESYEWIPRFGVTYSLGVDGVALVLILLSAVLVPIVVLASWHDAEGELTGAGGTARSVKTFFSLVLLTEAFLVGVFAATDLFLFYVFFEAMLVPMYFLIGSFGGPRRSYAAVKFLLYSLAGGLLMLAAVIGVGVLASDAAADPDRAFALSQLVGLDIDPGVEKALFLGFFAAFAIKAPMWPVHTWLPDAAAQSTPGTAVLLVGVLDKVGTFGMLRYCLELFPGATDYFTPLVVVLAVVSILYGAVVAIGQTDMRRLVAYTSISHFGFIVLGVFALTSQGLAGATLYMVNHGFSTGMLFLVAGFLIARHRSALIPDYSGVQSVAPWLAGAFLLAGLSSLSLPGLSTFVSEFLVLVGTFTRYEVAAVFATLGIVLAAVYILLWYQRTMTGSVKDGLERTPDLNVREAWVVAPMIAAIIALGVYPKPALDVITPAVESTLHQTGATDPEPTAGGTHQ